QRSRPGSSAIACTASHCFRLRLRIIGNGFASRSRRGRRARRERLVHVAVPRRALIFQLVRPRSADRSDALRARVVAAAASAAERTRRGERHYKSCNVWFMATSFVERQNLTMRMSMRRFTRLTNGFSKKLENHGHAIAIHYMYYNFGRIHQSLRVTPAMEAGISDHVWSIEEIVGLLDSNCPLHS